MSLKRNVLANYLGQLVSVTLTIVSVPVYIRLLGAEAYGLVGFFASLQMWFQVLDFGFSQSIAREVARLGGGAENAVPLRRTIRTMEVLFAFIATGSGVSLYFAAPWLSQHWLQTQQVGSAAASEAIRYMAGMIALRFVVAPHRSLLLGLEHQLSFNLFTSGVAVCRFAGILLISLWMPPSTSVFFGYQFALTVVETGALLFLAGRALPAISPGAKAGPALNFFRGSIRFASTVAFTSAVWIMVTYVDRLILSKLLPLAKFAYYSAGVSLASAVTILSAPASNALLPRMTRLIAEQREDAALVLYRQFTLWVAWVAFPVAAVLAFSPRLALWVWTGNESLADYSALSLCLYAIGNGLFSVAAFPYYLQYAKGDLIWHLYGNVIFAVVFLPLLAFAASAYGATGAATAWMAVNGLYLVCWTPIIHRRLAPGIHRGWMLNDIGRMALAVFGAVGTVALILPVVPGRFAGLIRLLAMGGAGYAAGLLAWWMRQHSDPAATTDPGDVILQVIQRLQIRIPLLRALIHWRQRRYIRTHLKDKTRVMVFIVPGLDTVNGGILAIIGHARESANLAAIHQSEVCVCTLPGQLGLLRYTHFRNDTTLLSLSLVLRAVAPRAHLHLHLPEVHVGDFVREGLPLLTLRAGLGFSFNIMLQNIDYVPGRSLVEALAAHGPVTVTTAHKAYAHADTGKLLDCPVHHWSVQVNPERYLRLTYAAKEKLVVVSPDAHSLRQQILDGLQAELPDHRFVVIRDMTYEEYKAIISRARFSLTFGEGLDGYFIEPIFSGALGFAVYNERFFTPEYRDLPGVYADWETLAQEMPALVRDTDQVSFTRMQAEQYAVAARNYCFPEYLENLRKYYESIAPFWRG